LKLQQVVPQALLIEALLERLLNGGLKISAKLVDLGILLNASTEG